MSFEASTSSPFAVLYDRLRSGAIDRRRFISGATALGMSAGVAHFCANAALAAPGANRNGFAFAAQAAPSAGTENQERGEGGELRILQWQAPSHLSPHTATGDKEGIASAIVLEPLMHLGENAELVPILITEVPTIDNGLLAEDLTSVTYNLLEGVTWSDGEPFTAEDVRFTWEWVMDEANNSINTGVFGQIADIEVVDDLTARVSFTGPNPSWFVPHTGAAEGAIYPKHILEAGGDAHDAFSLKPIGTGAFVVDEFTPNDEARFSANPNFREPNKPYFSNIYLKGGGDPASAARAVLETGEYHFAWYLPVEPEILRSMEEGSEYGRLIVYPSSYVERINPNFSDPNTEVDGQRSHKDTPHPFLTDPAVREAIALAIDRQLIADSFFFGGDQEPAVSNILVGIPEMESPNTSWSYDPEAANQVLDDAGWVLDGDTRSKDGVELRVRFVTSVNQVRQKIQAVVKANLEDIGIAVDLEQVDASIFFDSSAGNDQNRAHFYSDLNMYQTGPTTPSPHTFMEEWYAGENGENISQKENDWTGTNNQRYVNPDYDALFDEAKRETDPEAAAELFIAMNDLLINDSVIFTLVQGGEKSAAARWLNEANFGFGPFGYQYWNIANWNRVEE